MTKQTMIRVPWMAGFDGSEQDNSEMYDNTERIEGGGMAYCQDCGKVVCRMSTLRKQWKERGIRV